MDDPMSVIRSVCTALLEPADEDAELWAGLCLAGIVLTTLVYVFTNWTPHDLRELLLDQLERLDERAVVITMVGVFLIVLLAMPIAIVMVSR